MNTPNLACAGETGALSGDLRPCAMLPRPIPYPAKHQIRRIGGAR